MNPNAFTLDEKAIRGISVFLGFTSGLMLAYTLSRNCDFSHNAYSLNTYCSRYLPHNGEPIPQWLSGEPSNDQVHRITFELGSLQIHTHYRLDKDEIDCRGIAL